MSIFERVKGRIRGPAQRRVDNLVGPLYVHQDDLATTIGEMTRMLSDRFDAEAEASAIFGRRLAELTAAVEELRAEIDRLSHG